MRITKNASGELVAKVTKTDWLKIGKDKGWLKESADPFGRSDEMRADPLGGLQSGLEGFKAGDIVVGNESRTIYLIKEIMGDEGRVNGFKGWTIDPAQPTVDVFIGMDSSGEERYRKIGEFS